MTVVDNIEENIEKGSEGFEKISEKIAEEGKEVLKSISNVLEKDTEKIKRELGKGKNILQKIEEKVEEGVEKMKETIKEDAKKIKKAVEKKETKKKKSGKKKESETGEDENISDEKFSGDESLAELESLETEKNLESDLEKRKRELLERVKKLSEKVDVLKTEDLKEQVKGKKKTDMLVPLEEYVKTGIYIGKRAVTPDMKPFVYRRRADGLAIFNTDIIDEKLKEAIEYLSRFAPEDTILVCKRQTGWEVAEMFSRLTGIRVFTKKYPAGVLTNTHLPDFFENELTIITDSWLDKNALNDTLRVNKKILMICDTNNFANGADQIIIGNNKSSKSLGIIFYVLARGYCKAKGLDTSKIPDLEWWVKDRE
jgi:small subunit ribosomal protein S2